MIVAIIGVSGSGKTTIGTMLAEAMGCAFLDGDSLHSAANVDRMRHGTPLTDADRAPWLAAIHGRMLEAAAQGHDLVVGCSALEEEYRRTLAGGLPIEWVYLKGSIDLIRARLGNRSGHFMSAGLLDSQFDALEEPAGALVIDIAASPREIVRRILSALHAPQPDVRVFFGLAELSAAAAAAAVQIIDQAVRTSGRCSLALSGGSGPVILHRLLATTYKNRIPWGSIHVFWGDERYVPHRDPDSNYRLARETLLDHVPCPAANIHPMPTDGPSPDADASAYERTLKRYFGTGRPHVDLAVLGIGAEGHTASLFPGAPVLAEQSRWVAAVETPAVPPIRLTWTLPALTASAHSFVLVSGASKAHALRRAVTGPPDPDGCPASGLRLTRGTLTWWVDRAAAADLPLACPAISGASDQNGDRPPVAP